MKSWTLSSTSLGLIAALGLTGLALPGVARAADAPQAQKAQPETLETITVTVRKRSEKLQDVPESVAVLSSAELEHANVTGLRGFVDLTPNLTVRETFRSGETFLTMRGLSSPQNGLPPVAFVVDGVQIGSNDFISQDLFNIQSIQVLRGPQGALYGQGAIAGAIVITTKQPTNDLSVYANATYGNANSVRVAGAVSGPLVRDHLFGSIGGYYKSSDGLIKNDYGQRVTPYSDGYGRAELQFKNENLKVSWIGDYEQGKTYAAVADIAQKQDNVTGAIYPGTATPPDPYTVINTDQVQGPPGINSNVVGHAWDKNASTALKINYDFDGMTLTSISGYAYNREHVYADADYTAAVGALQDIYYTTKVANEDLRLASSGDNRFNWLVGGFYQYRKHQEVVLVGPDMGAPLDQQPGNVTPSFFDLNEVTQSHSYAVYGSASYNITKKLELDVALRYDHDSQTDDSLQGMTSPAESYASAAFHAVQPKAELSYHLTPDFLTYVTYSQGFRSGGFSDTTVYANETTKNYEFGFKSTLLDGKATINGSFFHTDYKNQQVSFTLFNTSTNPPTVSKGIINVPLTTIDGMELEVAARPVDHLTVQLGVGVTDSTIKQVQSTLLTGGNAASYIGKKSPMVSPLTFNASVNYDMPLQNDYDLLFHADYRRENGYWFDIANAIGTGTHSLLGGKIALQKDDWSIGVWGKNLLNDRYATFVEVTGTPYRFPNMPRSYGVEATYKF